MNTRSIAAAVIVAVFASATALAVDPPKKAASVAKAPVGVKIIPGLKFQSVRPKKSAQAILSPMRLPFGCSYGWGWSGGVEMSIWYKGTVPIQTEHLVVHWEIQYCCNDNVGAPTSNFLLYQNQGWYMAGIGAIPANFNRPPEGQPKPACTAYGWIEE